MSEAVGRNIQLTICDCGIPKFGSNCSRIGVDNALESLVDNMVRYWKYWAGSKLTEEAVIDRICIRRPGIFEDSHCEDCG